MIIIGEKREEVKVVDRNRLHTNDNRGEVIRRNSFKFIEEGMEAFRGLRERFLGEDISFRIFNTREKEFLGDTNNKEEFKRHRLDTYFLRLGKAGNRLLFELNKPRCLFVFLFSLIIFSIFIYFSLSKLFIGGI